MTDTKSSPLQILRRKQVEEIVGLSRTTIYNLIAHQSFPAPFPLGPRAVGWRKSDIEEWLLKQSTRTWPRARQTTAKAKGTTSRGQV